MFRVGFGEDIHVLKEGVPLIIGGVTVPSERGAVSHTDGDVLLHSICDALLGAASLPDIGTLFPDTDPSIKNTPSTILLKKVSQIIYSKNYYIVNIDSTVFLEEPRIGKYIPEIKKNIAAILSIPEENVSVKAATYEKMGPVGEKKAILARSVVLIGKKEYGNKPSPQTI